MQIVECPEEELSHIYLNSIDEMVGMKKTEYYYWIDQFAKELDKYGKPKKYNFGSEFTKKMSCSVIKYARMMCDLKDMFDFSKQTKIVEIGAGFCGLCLAFSKLHIQDLSYAIIDLAEVIELQKKFLSRYKLKMQVNLYDGTTFNSKEIENVSLFISTWAFSELSKDVQDSYLPIIKQSACGYILCNDYGEKHLNGYSINELLNFIPGSVAYRWRPRENDTIMLAWGFKHIPSYYNGYEMISQPQ